ncbi:winged helix-turn-helix domain-containing protein [Candidatus Bathyarchaeota archaeon]|nr:winged helix-turn-helix domain-containing protein [Candidatus Bathyarchaeota archaeon]
MAREKQVKRSRFETMYTILKICSKGSKKTHVMYRANLSHQQLEKYLAILIERNLLAIESGDYVTSPRGVVYIQKFDDLQRFMNEEVEAHARHPTI